MKRYLLAALLFFPVPLLADSVINPPSAGSFNVVPVPVNCNPTTGKLIWNGNGWTCATDRVGAANKPMPFTIVFARKATGVKGWASYRAQIYSYYGYTAEQSNMNPYGGVPMKQSGTAQSCPPRRQCTSVPRWAQMSASEFNSYRNNGYNVWQNFRSEFSCPSDGRSTTCAFLF